MSSQSSEDLATPLFRQEALDALSPHQYGRITLLPGANSRWMALLGLLFIMAIIVFLIFGTYTRRSTVVGLIYPAEGLIRITATQPGIVIERLVEDGQTVKRGSVLFVLSGDRLGNGNVNFQSNIAEQIESRRRLLEDDLKRTKQTEQLETGQLSRRLVSLRTEHEQVAQQGQLLSQRVKAAEDVFKRYEGLYKKEYISRDELLAKETELSELRSRMQGNRRDMLALERETVATQRDLDTVRTRTSGQRSELERSISSVRQEFSELEAKRRIVVTAPADGKITLLQSELGQSVEIGKPMAQLLPASKQLVARLYAPSRSAGFVREGDAVLMRLDAFPYQKYGQLKGAVLSVSNAAVNAADLLGYFPRTEAAAEAMFAIAVSLPEEHLKVANGIAKDQIQLQAGMRVDADLLHETRRLYEWILEPLYAAKSRL